MEWPDDVRQKMLEKSRTYVDWERTGNPPIPSEVSYREGYFDGYQEALRRMEKVKA